MIDLEALIPAWTTDAPCAHVANPEAWFPVVGTPAHDSQEAAAREVCSRCPVREKCLEFALAIETRPDGQPISRTERHGIWGGLSPYQRWVLAKERAA